MSETQTRQIPPKRALPQPGAERYDDTGPIRVLAAADGYIMVRRPRRTPWVMTLDAWLLLYQRPRTDAVSAQHQ